MTIEVRPTSVNCNLACTYCYQNAQRDLRLRTEYDFNAVKATLDTADRSFSIFGGEALLLSIDKLEELLEYGFGRFGSNRIQTNGTLITSTHVQLFHKYNVTVGFSIDGPGALNDLRWAGSEELTRAATSASEASIQRLLGEGIRVGLIVTLHRYNARRNRIMILRNWLASLASRGLKSARLHFLEVDDPATRADCALSDDENIHALLRLYPLHTSRLLYLDIFADASRLLEGDDSRASCVWNACDPLTTRAVQGIEGDGTLSNCGRTAKDGVNYKKASKIGYERYIALHLTHQADLGCAGCRFFVLCKGHCPGTGLAGDWRNRTEHCRPIFSIFTMLEQELVARGKIPISLRPDLAAIEQAYVEAWAKGENPSLQQTIGRVGRPLLDSASTQGAATAKREQADASGSPPSGRPGTTRLARFARMTWVSPAAEAVWRPRISEMKTYVSLTERSSVYRGARRCALQWTSVESLPAIDEESAERHCLALVIDRRNSQALVAIGAPREARHLAQAIRRGLHQEVGERLGYPECCVTAYIQRNSSTGELRPREPTIDLLVQRREPPAAREQPRTDRGLVTALQGTPECNILLRRAGLRLSPHEPCSASCASTIAFVAAMHESVTDARQWLWDLLSADVRWSTLHGIAEIVTPIFRLIHDSEVVPEMVAADFRFGERELQGAATGARFPFIAPNRAARRRRLPIVDPGSDVGSRPSADGSTISQPEAETEQGSAWRNGFDTPATMTVLHGRLVELAHPLLRRARGQLLDLGCGDGALLRALVGQSEQLRAFGVDVSADAVTLARAFARPGDRFIVSDMFDVDRWNREQRYALALVMIRRLCDVSPPRSTALRALLRSQVDYVMFYSYDSMGIPLLQACSLAGFDVLASDGELAAIGRFANA